MTERDVSATAERELQRAIDRLAKQIISEASIISADHGSEAGPLTDTMIEAAWARLHSQSPAHKPGVASHFRFVAVTLTVAAVVYVAFRLATTRLSLVVSSVIELVVVALVIGLITLPGLAWLKRAVTVIQMTRRTVTEHRHWSRQPGNADRAVPAEFVPKEGGPPFRGRWLRERWTDRFYGLGPREMWGYVTWSLVGLVIGIPEIWAAVGSPPLPTISATLGHLEALWSPVAVIVVAVITAAAFRAIKYPRRTQERTINGRLTKKGYDILQVPGSAYFSVAVAAIVVGTVLAVTLGSSRWDLAYVIYGLIAIFFVIVPNMLALWFAKEVPFPTLFRTVVSIEERWHVAAVVIVAGLAVLAIHVAFYPWPDIIGNVTTNAP